MEVYEPKGFALKIFKDRYAIHPEETFQEACQRVASFIASAEEGDKIKHFEKRFTDIMLHNRFSPGGRIWRGSNRRTSACMNCFVLPSEDSRNGWGELLKEVTIISGLGGGIGISFDNIRPRGSEIKGTGGVATGSVSLMKIVNGICDELREGGGRRGALLFGLSYWHPDVEEFLHVKLDEKALNNANISILVDNKFFDLVEQDGEIELKWQDKIVKTIRAKWLYDKVIENSLKTGDPGFLNIGLARETNNLYYYREQTVSNPCLPSRAKVLTKHGIKSIGDIYLGTEIWSSDGWTKVVNIIDRGIKSIYKFDTSYGYLESTENHNVVNNGSKLPVGESDKIDILWKTTSLENFEISSIDIMDGLVIGDGTLHKAGKKIYLCIGENDQDYFNSTIKNLILNQCPWKSFYKESAYEINTSISGKELPLKPVITIPRRFYEGSVNKIIGFLKGLYAANGSVVDGRVTLKASSKYLIYQVQQMLSSIGIRSYYTTNEGKTVKFEQGNYKCKESYDLNITRDRKIFAQHIGFIQRYKQEKLTEFIDKVNKCSSTFVKQATIKSSTYVEDIEVYDITVNNSSHTFWCNGFNVSNCGEQILSPYSVCCLGSINLSSHVGQNDKIDYSMLDDTIRLAVRFLDNVIDKNEYPLEIIKETAQKERRIGIGIMGLHDMLIKMGYKYSSEEAIQTIDTVMSFIKKKAYDASIFLAVEKGQFPLLDRDKFIQSGFCKKSLTPAIRKKILEYGIRNCFLLSIAPTGTISQVAGTSSGIEPIFSTVHKRNFNQHQDFHSSMTNQSSEIVIHPLFKEYLKHQDDVSIFEGAHDISPEQHCKIQTVCQKHIDNSISKTINLPKGATKEELSDMILQHIRNLKGMTIYRDGSKGESPLMQLTVDEAKASLDNVKAAVSSQDCSSGDCEVI